MTTDEFIEAVNAVDDKTGIRAYVTGHMYEAKEEMKEKQS